MLLEGIVMSNLARKDALATPSAIAISRGVCATARPKERATPNESISTLFMFIPLEQYGVMPCNLHPTKYLVNIMII